MDGVRITYGFIDHLYTPLGTTLYRSLTHTQTSVLSLLHSPLTVSWQRYYMLQYDE
jgi:hypothetical protein